MASRCWTATSPGRRRKPLPRRPKLPGPVYVVKSQIHAGGRGAGRFADDPNGKGGVRLAHSPDEVRAAAEAMLGHTLITKQTGPAGRGRASRLCRGRLRHRARAVSVAADRPRDLARRHHGLHRRRHGDRGGRRAPPGENPARRRRSGVRHFALPRAAGWPSASASTASRSPPSPSSSPRCTRRSSRSTARSSRSTRWS